MPTYNVHDGATGETVLVKARNGVSAVVKAAVSMAKADMARRTVEIRLNSAEDAQWIRDIVADMIAKKDRPGRMHAGILLDSLANAKSVK